MAPSPKNVAIPEIIANIVKYKILRIRYLLNLEKYPIFILGKMLKDILSTDFLIGKQQILLLNLMYLYIFLILCMNYFQI